MTSELPVYGGYELLAVAATTARTDGAPPCPVCGERIRRGQRVCRVAGSASTTWVHVALCSQQLADSGDDDPDRNT